MHAYAQEVVPAARVGAVGECEAWSRHRDLLAAVPRRAAGHRGCIGLGAAADADGRSLDAWVTARDQVFIPDRGLCWFTVRDVPRGHAQVGTVLRATVQYGMPRLGPGVVARFDLRRHPGPAAGPGAPPRGWRVFGRLSWAMTEWAARHDRDWRVARRSFLAGLGGPAGAAIPACAVAAAAAAAPRPAAWFPRAYLGFPAAVRDRLWGRATAPGGIPAPYLGDAFKDAFLADVGRGMPLVAPCDGVVAAVDRAARRDGRPCTAVTLTTALGPWVVAGRAGLRLAAEAAPGRAVEAGQVLGHAGPPLPATWAAASDRHRWQVLVPGLFGRRLEWELRTWFAQQMRGLRPGYVHLPAALAAPAAPGSAADDQLFWDVAPGLDYFDDADAFIFPPLAVAHWRVSRLAPTAEIDLDLDLDLDLAARDARRA